MPRRHDSLIAALAAALLTLTGCGKAPAATGDAATTAPGANRPKLGLMTSLPLYWPERADMAALASGQATPPWQRNAIETRFALVPLDTLASVPALSPDSAPIDPLAGIDRLAVIQPRGLSPADNVALDAWVRGGGRLLLALDPALTGEYASPLGDPRRPVDTALIPPVVARWGMSISFDEDQPPSVVSVRLDGAELPLALAGRIAVTDPDASPCTLLADGAAARCSLGKGQVTLIADAALFEHSELAGKDGERLLAIMSTALELQHSGNSRDRETRSRHRAREIAGMPRSGPGFAGVVLTKWASTESHCQAKEL